MLSKTEILHKVWKDISQNLNPSQEEFLETLDIVRHDLQKFTIAMSSYNFEVWWMAELLGQKRERR